MPDANGTPPFVRLLGERRRAADRPLLGALRILSTTLGAAPRPVAH